MKPLSLARIIGCVLGSLLATHAGAVDWQPRFEQALGECQAISARDYQTGLIFNPEGHQTYYQRSRCLQGLAVEWREPSLCEQVRERRSLFFNGKGIAETACREKVATQIEQDQTAAAALDPDSFHKLEAVHFDQPHYVGDNIRQQVKTRGSHPGSYQVRVELWPNDSGEPVVIADYSQPLGGADHILSGTIPNQRLREAFGGSIPDHEIRVRVTLALLPRSHRDQFVLTQIPEPARRSQIVTTLTWQQPKPQPRHPDVGD